MKNFIFFLLLVGVLGCEPKSKKKLENDTDSTEREHSNLRTTGDNSAKLIKIINRAEFEIIKVYLKSGKSRKSDEEKKRIDNDINEFTEKLPDTDSTSWDDNKVIEVFDEIRSREYESTKNKIEPLEAIKIMMPQDKQQKDSIIKYLVNPVQTYKDNKEKRIYTWLIVDKKDTLNKKIIDFINDNYNTLSYENYKKNMTAFIKGVYDITTADPVKKPVNDDPSKEGGDSANDFLSQFIGFLLLIVILLGIWQYLENKKLKSEQDKTTKKLNEQLDEIIKLKTENQKLENEIFNFKQKQTNDPYHSTGGNSEQVSDNNTGLLSTDLQAVTINNRSEPNLIKYAGRPNEDGSFIDISDKFILGKSLYCLDIKDSKAEFWIDDDPTTFANLTRFPDALLRPVCEELNTQNSSHIHLNIQENGQAQWDEEKQVWRVTQKAKIKYS